MAQAGEPTKVGVLGLLGGFSGDEEKRECLEALFKDGRLPSAEEVMKAVQNLPHKTRVSLLAIQIRDAKAQGRELDGLADLVYSLLTMQDSSISSANESDNAGNDSNDDSMEEASVSPLTDNEFVRVLYADANPVRMTNRQDLAEIALTVAPQLGRRGADMLLYAVAEASVSMQALAMRGAVKCKDVLDEELVMLVSSARTAQEMRTRTEQVLRGRPSTGVADALFENLRYPEPTLAFNVVMPNCSAGLVIKLVRESLDKVLVGLPLTSEPSRPLLNHLPMKRLWNRYSDSLLQAYETYLQAAKAKGGAHALVGVGQIHLMWASVVQSWQGVPRAGSTRLLRLIMAYPPFAFQNNSPAHQGDLLKQITQHDVNELTENVLQLKLPNWFTANSPILSSLSFQQVVDVYLGCFQTPLAKTDPASSLPLIVSSLKWAPVAGTLGKHLHVRLNRKLARDIRFASSKGKTEALQKLITWYVAQITKLIQSEDNVTLGTNNETSPLVWDFTLCQVLPEPGETCRQGQLQREATLFSRARARFDEHISGLNEHIGKGIFGAFEIDNSNFSSKLGKTMCDARFDAIIHFAEQLLLRADQGNAATEKDKTKKVMLVGFAKSLFLYASALVHHVQNISRYLTLLRAMVSKWLPIHEALSSVTATNAAYESSYGYRNRHRYEPIQFSESTFILELCRALKYGKEGNQWKQIMKVVLDGCVKSHLERLEFMLQPHILDRVSSVFECLNSIDNDLTSLLNNPEVSGTDGFAYWKHLIDEVGEKGLAMIVNQWQKYARHSAFEFPPMPEDADSSMIWSSEAHKLVKANYEKSTSLSLQRDMLARWESMVSTMYAPIAQSKTFSKHNVDEIFWKYRPPCKISPQIFGNLLVKMLIVGPEGASSDRERLCEIVKDLAKIVRETSNTETSNSLSRILATLVRFRATIPIEKVFPGIGEIFVEAVTCDEHFLFSFVTSQLNRLPGSSSSSIDFVDRTIHVVMTEFIPQLKVLRPSEQQTLIKSLESNAHMRDRAFAKTRREACKQKNFSPGRRQVYSELLRKACQRKGYTSIAQLFANQVRSIMNEQGPYRLEALADLNGIWDTIVPLFLLVPVVDSRFPHYIVDTANQSGFLQAWELPRCAEQVRAAFEKLTQDTVGAINMDARSMTAAKSHLEGMISYVQTICCFRLEARNNELQQSSDNYMEERKKWYISAAKCKLMIESVTQGTRALESIQLGFASMESAQKSPLRIDFDTDLKPMLDSVLHQDASETARADYLRAIQTENKMIPRAHVTFEIDVFELLEIVQAGYASLGLDEPFSPSNMLAPTLERLNSLVTAIGAFWPAIPGILKTIETLSKASSVPRDRLCDLRGTYQLIQSLFNLTESFEPLGMALPSLRSAIYRLVCEGIPAASKTYIYRHPGESYDANLHKSIASGWEKVNRVNEAFCTLGANLEHLLTTKLGPRSLAAFHWLNKLLPPVCSPEDALNRKDIQLQARIARDLLRVDKSAVHLPFVQKVLCNIRQDHLWPFVNPLLPHENFAGQFQMEAASTIESLLSMTDPKEREEFLQSIVGFRLGQLGNRLRLQKLPVPVLHRLAEQCWEDFSNEKLTFKERQDALVQWLRNPSLGSREVVNSLVELYEVAAKETEESNALSPQTQGSISSIIAGMFSIQDPLSCLGFLLSPSVMQKDYGNATATALAGARQKISESKFVELIRIVLGPDHRKVLKVGLHKSLVRLLTSLQTPAALDLLKSEWNQKEPALHLDVKRVIVQFALSCLDSGRDGRAKAEDSWLAVEADFAMSILQDLATATRHEMDLRGYLLGAQPENTPYIDGPDRNKFWRSHAGTFHTVLSQFKLEVNRSDLHIDAAYDAAMSTATTIHRKHASEFYKRVIVRLACVARPAEESFVIPVARVLATTSWAEYVQDADFIIRLLSEVQIQTAPSLKDLTSLAVLAESSHELFQVRGLSAALVWHRLVRQYCKDSKEYAITATAKQIEDDVNVLLTESRINLNKILLATARLETIAWVALSLANESQREARIENYAFLRGCYGYVGDHEVAMRKLQRAGLLSEGMKLNQVCSTFFSSNSR